MENPKGTEAVRVYRNIYVDCFRIATIRLTFVDVVFIQGDALLGNKRAGLTVLFEWVESVESFFASLARNALIAEWAWS